MYKGEVSACNVKPLPNIVEAHITRAIGEGLAVPTKNGSIALG